METATQPQTAALVASDVTDLVVRKTASMHPDDARKDGWTLALTPRARKHFSQGTVDLLAAKYADAIKDGADVRAFMGLIELSAELGLNPITGQIWLVKFAGRWQPMVGRDGYVAIARRDPNYLGCAGGVHRANDKFTALYDGEQWIVRHGMAGGNAARGEILGAWALLKRKDAPDVYFYADQATYDGKKNAWKSHPDAMIQKVPQSYVHRITYGVTGPEPADELLLGVQPGQVIPTPAEASSAPALDVIPEPLLALLRRAYAVDKSRWRRNEITARIPDERTDPEGNAQAVADITAEVTKWLEENEPQDAEVVHEGEEQATPAPTPAPAAAEQPQPQAGEEPTPADPDAAQQRWEQDPDWRQEVHMLQNRAADLDAAAPDLSGQEQADAYAEIDSIEQHLARLGVPSGWTAQAAGQIPMPL